MWSLLGHSFFMNICKSIFNTVTICYADAGYTVRCNRFHANGHEKMKVCKNLSNNFLEWRIGVYQKAISWSKNNCFSNVYLGNCCIGNLYDPNSIWWKDLFELKYLLPPRNSTIDSRTVKRFDASRWLFKDQSFN